MINLKATLNIKAMLGRVRVCKVFLKCISRIGLGSLMEAPYHLQSLLHHEVWAEHKRFVGNSNK
jgi:hypothetical protein